MITQFKTFRISWPLAATLLAWLLPVFAWSPLTYPGYFEFHSGFLPIFNLNGLMRHLADLGWMPTVGQPYDLMRGEGALAYRLAALLRLLGTSPVAAVKWTFGLSLLAGALGMYGWTRRRLGPWPALLASMVYTYWPILLATIYVRGALAEAVFLGLAPWGGVGGRCGCGGQAARRDRPGAGIGSRVRGPRPGWRYGWLLSCSPTSCLHPIAWNWSAAPAQMTRIRRNVG